MYIKFAWEIFGEIVFLVKDRKTKLKNTSLKNIRLKY